MSTSPSTLPASTPCVPRLPILWVNGVDVGPSAKQPPLLCAYACMRVRACACVHARACMRVRACARAAWPHSFRAAVVGGTVQGGEPPAARTGAQCKRHMPCSASANQRRRVCVRARARALARAHDHTHNTRARASARARAHTQRVSSLECLCARTRRVVCGCARVQCAARNGRSGRAHALVVVRQRRAVLQRRLPRRMGASGRTFARRTFARCTLAC